MVGAQFGPGLPPGASVVIALEDHEWHVSMHDLLLVWSCAQGC
jgi:hypothetical protein